MYGLYVFQAAAAPKTFDWSPSTWLTTWGEGQPAGAMGFHLFDVINCILLILTLRYIIQSTRLAEAALNKSHTAYVRTLTDTRYDAMDRVYFELLRSKREHPIKDPNDDPFPLMVWNFVETIIDKCDNDESGELMKTWGPLVSAESCNHAAWMLSTNEKGHYKHSPYFKNEFLLLAHSLISISRATLVDGNDVKFPVFLRLFRALEAEKNDLGLTTDKAFHEQFAKVFADQGLQKAASDEAWELDDRIKNDDIKNNETARKAFREKKHNQLRKLVLAAIMSQRQAKP